jgi:protein SCO1
VKKHPYLVGFFVGAVLLTLLPFLQERFLKAPPPIGDLGAWSLVDQDGAPFGSRELAGHVVVVGTFFTRCPSVCPALMEKMKNMHRAVEDLGPRVRFVAITVDPEHDQPAVLKEYARKLGADPARWTFVTGERAAVEDLLVKRMMVGVGEKQAQGDLFDIAHSTRFALVDQKGRLRALWPTEDPHVGNLVNAARLLAKRGPDV